jgi:fimbrial chaperone protein
MARRASLLAGSLLALTVVATAASAKGQLQARATLLELGVDSAAGRLTLANTGDAPVTAQVRVFAWAQQGGQDRLAPTTAIVLSPPIVKIPPNGEQVVRIVRQGPAPAGRDQTYRVVVDELPDRSRPNATAISFRMRFVLPLFVRDAVAKPPSLTCGIERLDQATVLTCSNSGGRAAQLGATTLLGAGGQKYELTPGLFGYVLPVSARRWTLDPTHLAKLGSNLRLETRLNGDPLTLPLATSAP